MQGISAFAQYPGCDNGRYLDSLFGVTVTSDLIYGNNLLYNGIATDLKLDVYEPSGDIQTVRPLIIFAPKGSFIQESKTEHTMVQLCTHFASLGYVAVAIDYRVGVNYTAVMQNAQLEFTKAVLRAAHDYKAAIRYFRKDAATTNTFKIDSGLIIAGGSSAGAITALHVAYLDSESEVPAYVDTTGLGGVEGLSGNPGYSSRPHFVVNLCGAIADTTWIDPGNIPVISMHGNLDTEVPYGTATISMMIPIMEVDGSASVYLRAQHIGLQNLFHTFWGRTHIPYDENAGGAYLQYMDTVKAYVTQHLFDWVCGATKAESLNINIKPEVYPNPANDEVMVMLPAIFSEINCSIEVMDFTGKSCFSRIVNGFDSSHKISLASFPKGVYFIRIIIDNTCYAEKLIKL